MSFLKKLLNKVTDDILGFDPNGQGIYKVARNVLGDTIADDMLGFDPHGGGSVPFTNVAGPLALAYFAGGGGGDLFGSSAGASAGAGASGAGAGASSFGNIAYGGGLTASTAAGLTAPGAAGTGSLLGGLSGGVSGLGGGALLAAPSAASAAGGLGGAASWFNPGNVGSALNVASGLYGMKLAGDARDASDPFAPYRAGYAERLMALEANPQSITQTPGWSAGIEAIDRSSAASGFLGSGNQMAALSRYGGQFYQAEANRLATLAGAGQTPGAGQFPAAQLTGQSLGSIGYGLGRFLQGWGG